MNIYVVAEGEVTEKKVYQSWIPLVNPRLTYVERADLLSDDNFTIYAGGGFPFCLSMAESAIQDIDELGNIHRLVIAVDSEDLSYEEKQAQVLECVTGLKCSAEIHIIVQHFCFECWALGNRKISRSKPQDPLLRNYKRFFNVAVRDPERLTPYPGENLTRAQFAGKYLRLLLMDKFKELTYSKSNPKVVLHHKYFEQVRNRFMETGHIRSFSDFLTAFSPKTGIWGETMDCSVARYPLTLSPSGLRDTSQSKDAQRG